MGRADTALFQNCISTTVKQSFTTLRKTAFRQLRGHGVLHPLQAVWPEKDAA